MDFWLEGTTCCENKQVQGLGCRAPAAERQKLGCWVVVALVMIKIVSTSSFDAIDNPRIHTLLAPLQITNLKTFTKHKKNTQNKPNNSKLKSRSDKVTLRVLSRPFKAYRAVSYFRGSFRVTPSTEKILTNTCLA